MERQGFLPRKVELLGFKTEPNTAVPMLQEVLGIEFKNPPAQISLESRRNRIGAKLLYPNYDPTRGFFYEGLNAVFVMPQSRDTTLTAFHESMHGWFNENNSELELLDDVRTVFTGKVLGFSAEIWQMIMSYYTVNEGIAEYGSILTRSVFNEGSDMWATRLKKYRDRKNEYLNGILSPRLPGRSFSLENFKAFKGSKDFIYGAGFNFVEEVTAQLQKEGATVGESLKFIVKDPPIDTNELADPSLYLQRAYR